MLKHYLGSVTSINKEIAVVSILIHNTSNATNSCVIRLNSNDIFNVELEGKETITLDSKVFLVNGDTITSEASSANTINVVINVNEELLDGSA